MMRLKIFYLLSLFFLPLAVYAATPSSISVNVAPENPAPNEEVVITLSSYATNLDSVNISWRVDGKTAAAGVGRKTFSATAPEGGKELRIVVSVTLPDDDIEKTIVLRPTVMALLWQANDSYVPPFYRGRALPTVQSELKIVALPEIKSGTATVNPKNLIYAWKKDYTNDQGASGYGKNYYIFTNDYLEDRNNVSVAVSTSDGKYSSAGDLDVRVFDTKILFYKVDSALGTLWEQALPNGHHIEGEEIIQAAPYFISPSEIRLPSLKWSWSINNTYVSVGGINTNTLPVRADTGISGASRIKVEISNKYKLLSDVEKEISVEF